jgi:hypothetical protein
MDVGIMLVTALDAPLPPGTVNPLRSGAAQRAARTLSLPLEDLLGKSPQREKLVVKVLRDGVKRLRGKHGWEHFPLVERRCP